MTYPVFISYSRNTSRPYAEALWTALQRTETPAFLDTSDIEVGAQFPQVLVDAILDACVFVLFADARYFHSWYCLHEMRLALAEFDARVMRSEDEATRRLALAHMVIALHPDGVAAEELSRLPAALTTENSAKAGETDKLVAIVQARAHGPTLRERQRSAAVLQQAQSELVTASLLPQAANLAGLRLYPPALPMPLGDGFVGRNDELWRLDHLLATGRTDPAQTAAPTVALHGGAGTGKSRLALEYAYRRGPSRFPGGIFWVDASGTQDVETQHHGIWQRIDPAQHTATLPELRKRGENMAALLAQALHEQPRESPILFVLDHVPEAPANAPAPPLKTWCPAQPGDVAVLASSRRRLDVGAPGVEVVTLGNLTSESAVALLTRDLDASKVDAAVWTGIAQAVGNWPLALDLLNKAIEAGATDPMEVRKSLTQAEIVAVVDEQAETLRKFVSEETVRGVTEAFNVSFRLLPEDTQRVAVLFAFLAPAPIPFSFLEVLELDTRPRLVRTRLVTHAFLSRYGEDDKIGSAPMGQMDRVLASFLRTQSQKPAADRMMAVYIVSLALGTLDMKDQSQWPLLRAGLPHVSHVLDNVNEAILRDDPNDVGVRATFLRQLAQTLHQLGAVSGERLALTQGIRALRIAVQAYDPGSAPAEWAAVQLALVRILREFATREPGTGMLEEAAKLCNEVIQRGDQLPTDTCLEAQADRATILEELGQRTGSVEPISEAVDLLRTVLAATDRKELPLVWAATQNNLANALVTLGTWSDNTAAIDEGISAYRAALEEYTRTLVPYNWARTQVNLANAIFERAQREEGPTSVASLQEAVALHRQALEVITREETPRDWAQLQRNLGAALSTLVNRDDSVDHRPAAVDAYFAALEEIKKEDDPLQWAELSETVGCICQSLAGDQEPPDNSELLETVLGSFENSLEVFTREADPAHWTLLQKARGKLLAQLSQGESGTQRLQDAIEAFRGVLDVLAQDASERPAIAEQLRSAQETLASRRGAAG